MPAPDPPRDAVFRFQHTAMAAQFEIRCCHADEAYARQASRFAFAIVDRLEQQFSRFVENSDIAAVSRLAPGESTRVAYETMQCLQLARLLYEETGGAFDPSIGSGFEELDLLPEEFTVRRVIGRTQRSALTEPDPGLRTAPFDAAPDALSASRGADSGLRPVCLDLGAIGKGYAVDRVSEALEEWDVTRALIDAGYSSVLALDPPPGRAGWSLTLTAPGAGGGVFARLEARQQALGASGVQKGDHIRDPRSGQSVRGRLGAWVSAPREVLADISGKAGVQPSPTAVADALSTAFMILRPDEIEAYCHPHPGLDAWVVEAETNSERRPWTITRLTRRESRGGSS